MNKNLRWVVDLRLVPLLSLLLLLLTSFSALASPLTCKVSGAPNWYPVFFYQQDKPTGVMVDVLSAVGEALDIQFEYEYRLPWTWAKHQVERGDIDLLAGAFFTLERSKRFVYSTPVLKGHVHVFTKKARNLKVQSLGDLSELHGLRPLGSSFGDSFDRYAEKHLSLTEVTPKETMLKMLLHDRTDYLVMLERDGKEQLINPEYADEILMHENPKIPIDIFLVFAKNTPCVKRLGQINQVISRLKESGIVKSAEANYKLPH